MDNCFINNIHTQKEVKEILTKTMKSSLAGDRITNLKTAIQEILNNCQSETLQESLPNIIANIIGKYAKARGWDKNSNFYTQDNLVQFVMTREVGENFKTIEVADVIQNYEDGQIRSNVDIEFFHNSYGSAFDAKKYADLDAKKYLVDALFLRRGYLKYVPDKGTVLTTSNLNENIRYYQQQLLDEIVDYLIKDVKLSKDDLTFLQSNPQIYKNSRFSSSATYIKQNGLDRVLQISDKYLQPHTVIEPTELNTLFKDRANEKSLRKLRAYNARVILKNFDSYMAVTLGDGIQIKDFGRKTGKKNKYILASKQTQVESHFRTTDPNPEVETDRITKLLIEILPLYRFGTRKQIGNTYLQFNEFQSVIGKIKNLIIQPKAHELIFDSTFIDKQSKIWNSLSKETQDFLYDKNLAQAIAYFRIQDEKALTAVLELLVNENFQKSYKNDFLNPNLFNDNEIDIIWSIYDGVYSLDKESNSINLASKATEKINYYNHINQVVNSLFNTSFLQLYQDPEGDLKVRYLTDADLENTRRTIINKITSKTADYFLSNQGKERYKNDVIKKYNIKYDPDTKYISFQIPINQNSSITANVSLVEQSISFEYDKKTLNTNDIQKLFENPDLNLLKFTDEFTRLNLSENTNLLELARTYSSKTGFYEDLLKFTGRIIANQYVSINLIDRSSGYQARKSIRDIFGSDNTRHFRYTVSTGQIPVYSYNDKTFLRALAQAKLTDNKGSKSIHAKDSEGNAQTLQTFSRLAGSLTSMWEIEEKKKPSFLKNKFGDDVEIKDPETGKTVKKIKENEYKRMDFIGSATRDFQLLNKIGLYKGYSQFHEFYRQGTKTKAVKDFTAAETIYANLVYMFSPSLYEDSEDNFKVVNKGDAFLYAMVASDKNFMDYINIGIFTEMPLDKSGKNTKRYSDFTAEEHRRLIQNELGPAYQNAYMRIENDYKALNNYIRKEFIKNFARNHPNIDLVNRLNQFKDLDYASNFKEYKAWYEENSLNPEFKKLFPSEISFVRKAVREYNQNFPFNPIQLIDNLHVTGNNLVMSNPLISQLNTLSPEFLAKKGIFVKTFDEEGNRQYYDINTYWKYQSAEMLRSMVNSKFEVDFSNSSHELKLLKDHINNKYGQVTETTKDSDGKEIKKYNNPWISYNKLVLAKLHTFKRDFSTGEIIYKDDGTPEMVSINIIDPVSVRNINLYGRPKINDILNNIEDYGYIELNPIIEKYMYVDYLMSQEYLLSSVGSFIGHPEKSGSTDQLKQESSQNLAQVKRNVQLTAQVNQISANKIFGPALICKMATIQEYSALGHVLSGKNRKIKPFDGMTVVSPFANHLENGGLMGASVGNVKKNFCTFKHLETGTGGVIKTANFPLTNNLLRDSPRRHKVMKKMTDISWTDESGKKLVWDITKDFLGEQIDYGEDLNDSKKSGIFFRGKDGKIYRVKPLIHEGNNTYKRIVVAVNPTDGKDNGPDLQMDLDNNITTESVVIDSNYKLWKAFGGAWSMEITDNPPILSDGTRTKFVPSEKSVLFVVDAMNSVGWIKDQYKNITDYRHISQEEVFQPLKYSDIQWIMTEGSIKQGAANMNPVEAWENDEPLDFQLVQMTNVGPQLDKEHHAQNSQVSLMGQVMSSVAQTPYTRQKANNIYKGLATIVDIGLKKLLDPFNNYIKNKRPQDILEFRNAIMDILIKSLAKPDSDVFAEQLAFKIKNSVLDGNNKYKDVIFPISDNPLFNKCLSSFSSFISKAAIKLKITGNLSVLNPTDEFVKIYDGKSYSQFLDFNKEIEEIQQKYDQDPIYTKEKSPYDLSKMEFGRTYKVIFDNAIFDHPDKIWTPELTSFRGLNIEYSSTSIRPFDIFGNTVIINPKLVELEFNLKPWKTQKTPYDFKTINEWITFQLTRASIQSDLQQHPAEENSDYDIRLSNTALQILSGNPNININYTLNSNKLEEYLKDIHKQRTDETNTEYNDRIQAEVSKELNRLQDPSEGDLQYIKLTPDNYFELKKLAKQGKIKKIIEYVKEGRDLDPYNIRFSGDVVLENGMIETRNYNLWDLESVQRKWEVVDLIERKNLTEEDLTKYLLDFQEKEGVEAPNLDFVYKYYSRQVQKDLLDLSTSATDKVIEFENILKIKDTNIRNSQIAIFAHHRLSEKEKQQFSNLTTINDKINFIRNSESLQKIVKIDGDSVKINPDSIQVQAYELIMPKLWVQEFGFDQDTKLEEVKNDPDWFTKRFLINKTFKETDYYDVVLENMNGKHIYILNKSNLSKYNNSQKKVLEKLDVEVVKDLVDGKYYRQDSRGENMYEVPEGTTFYTDGDTEIIVLRDTKNDPFIKNLKQFIESSQYTSINFGESYLSGDPNIFYKVIEELSQVDDNLKWMYKQASRQADNLFANQDDDVEELVYTSAAIYEFKQLLKKDLKFEELSENHPFKKLGAKKYAAFLKSLDVVAARIPAQSMQSFMAMKVVMYENPDLNNAYVNNLQLFLQGSDLDIDAVTLCTYNINRSGLLDLWSPYANINDSNSLNESMKLPLPNNTSLIKNGKVKVSRKSLENVTKDYDYFKKLFKFVNDNGTLKIKFDNSLENLKLIGELVQLERIPTINSKNTANVEAFKDYLKSMIPFEVSGNIIEQFNNALAQAIDRHNLYLDETGTKNYNKLFRIMNNFIHSNTYDVIIDPANQQVGQESVDGFTTKLIKSISESSEEALAIKINNSRRGPGNSFGKAETKQDTQEGKDCIAKAASGLKAYFTAFEAVGNVLDSKNTEAQGRLIKRKDSDKGYQFLLSNVFAQDISTITNQDVLDCILAIETEQDAVQFLSSLLGLSADNAKELVLSKINAGVNIIGLYLYGISAGIDFREISAALMSSTGRVVKELFEGNIFGSDPEFFKLTQVFKYFDKDGFDQYMSTCTKSSKCFKVFKENVPDKFKNIYKAITDFSIKTYELRDVINEEISKAKNIKGLKRHQYVAFLRTLLNYVNNYRDTRYDTRKFLRHLAYGAQEMQEFGQFILNQGLDGDLEATLKTVLDLEYLIQDTISDFKSYHKFKTPEEVSPYIEEDSNFIIDIEQLFAEDGIYLKECIERLNRYTHSINKLELLSNAKDKWSYLKTRVVTDSGYKLTSYRYRSIRDLMRSVKKSNGSLKVNKIISKLSTLVQQAQISEWLYTTDKSFELPVGNTYFDPNSNMESAPIKEPRTIQLGTDAGNNTFRMWMEREVIPDLKAGRNIQGANPIQKGIGVKNNGFIKRLEPDTVNNQGLGNTMSLYTLDNVNCMPKEGSSEDIILKEIISEYEKLGEYSYAKGKKDLSDPFLNLKNLFTLYTMIAFNWKPGENSLFKVVSNNTDMEGYIKEYSKFLQALDYSSQKLSDNINIEDQIGKLMAQKESPYASNSDYIIITSPDFGNVLAENIKNMSDVDYDYDPEEGEDTLIRGNYQGIKSDINLNYFPQGISKDYTKLLTETRSIRKIDENGVEQVISGTLTVHYGGQESVSFNGKSYDLKELGNWTKVPRKHSYTQDKYPRVNTDKIMKAIENYENPKKDC